MGPASSGLRSKSSDLIGLSPAALRLSRGDVRPSSASRLRAVARMQGNVQNLVARLEQRERAAEKPRRPSQATGLVVGSRPQTAPSAPGDKQPSRLVTDLNALCEFLDRSRVYSTCGDHATAIELAIRAYTISERLLPVIDDVSSDTLRQRMAHCACATLHVLACELNFISSSRGSQASELLRQLTLHGSLATSGSSVDAANRASEFLQKRALQIAQSQLPTQHPTRVLLEGEGALWRRLNQAAYGGHRRGRGVHRGLSRGPSPADLSRSEAQEREKARERGLFVGTTLRPMQLSTPSCSCGEAMVLRFSEKRMVFTCARGTWGCGLVRDGRDGVRSAKESIAAAQAVAAAAVAARGEDCVGSEEVSRTGSADGSALRSEGLVDDDED